MKLLDPLFVLVSGMKLEDRMSYCRARAMVAVSRSRRMIPADHEYFNGAGIAAAIIAAGATVYSVQAQKAAQKKQQEAAAGALAGNPFGEVPDAAPYVPVNFNQEQLNSIWQNRDALPYIRQLDSQTNNFVTKQAQKRATDLIPNYTASMQQMGDNTLDLLHGQLPFQDVLDIISNQAGQTGSIGTPGTAGPATLKDLGISRLDAMNQGSGMLSQMIQNAQAISPTSNYTNPQQFFMNPLDRINLMMQQNVLNQQSQQNANNLKAGADPNVVARTQLNLGQALTGGQGGTNQAAMQGYASAAQSLISGINQFGTNQGYWGTAKPNAAGGYPSERAMYRALPDSYTAVDVPGRGWQPLTEAEWYGDWSQSNAA